MANPLTSEPSPAPPPRVLVVEDVPEIRLLIALMLRKRGMEVEQADNGAQAIERVEAAQRQGRPFAMAFMDIQMPTMDGLEATRRLRAAGVGFPIIALTAHSRPGERERCLRSGCTEFIAKPVGWDALRACIAKFLSPTGANSP